MADLTSITRDRGTPVAAVRLEQTRQPASPARGIVRASIPDGTVARARLLPSEALAPFVHHVWSVRWDVRTPYFGEALPHPSAHIAFREPSGMPRAEVGGVCTGRHARRLVGAGRVFGITFRPAAFRALWCGPMARLKDRVVPVAHLFGPEGDAWADAMFAAPALDAQLAIAEAFLTPRVRPLAPDVARLRDLVERLARDRSFLRVDDVARAMHVDVRTVERRFAHDVGASPKWVLHRYRLHEAAEQLRAPDGPPLAEVAASLGYADQAHFARDFKRVVGRTPRAFRAELAP